MLTPALAAVSMMLPILLWRADTCAWIGESVGSTTWFWISPIFTWNVCIVKVPKYFQKLLSIFVCDSECCPYLPGGSGLLLLGGDPPGGHLVPLLLRLVHHAGLQGQLSREDGKRSQTRVLSRSEFLNFDIW